LQVCVEIIIDVAERIIAQEGAGPVAESGEAMQSLVQLNIIKSAVPYTDMIKFRNLVVHQYEEIILICCMNWKQTISLIFEPFAMKSIAWIKRSPSFNFCF
jgi:hypothetical protein